MAVMGKPFPLPPRLQMLQKAIKAGMFLSPGSASCRQLEQLPEAVQLEM